MFSYEFLVVLLIQFACAAHVIRSGRPYLWILAIMFLPLIGCVGYFVFAVLPDMLGRPARQLAGGIAQSTGRGFREKKRLVERVGSADSKRALAEEYLARGEPAEAVALYKGAMVGALEAEPSLLLGIGRALLQADDGAGAAENFEALRQADPVLFNESAHLLYARALEIQGKNAEALREYEVVAPVYAGQEARLRLALLLKKLGQHERAQGLFREIVESMRGAPLYVRRREREWVGTARQHLFAR